VLLVGAAGIRYRPAGRHRSRTLAICPRLFLTCLPARPAVLLHCVPLSVLQRQILDKLREAEKGVDKEVEEVIAERRRCRELMVSEWRVSGCTPAAAPARVLRCRCSAWPCCSAYAVLCCAVHCIVCPSSVIYLYLFFMPGLRLPLLFLPLQEQAYGRLTGQKKEQRAKNNIFYSNRSFSRDVRKVRAGVGAGVGKGLASKHRKCLPGLGGAGRGVVAILRWLGRVPAATAAAATPCPTACSSLPVLNLPTALPSGPPCPAAAG
jgi:hypothetical protein